MQKLQLPVLIAIILVLNAMIYVLATFTDPGEQVFAECARNSGRTSALLNLILLFMLGHFGLKKIFESALRKKAFVILTSLFAVNHLVHFFFVTQNFDAQGWEFRVIDNLHGMLTFMSLLLLPLLLFRISALNRVTYFGIILHFVNITYFISDTFYARYKPIDPAYLHRIGIFIMAMALVYVFYRVYVERELWLHVKRDE